MRGKESEEMIVNPQEKKNHLREIMAQVSVFSESYDWDERNTTVYK